MKKILFAVSSLGLGHASRTLPLIKAYLAKDYHITIVSHAKALAFLQEELKDKKVTFIDLEDYPRLERGTGLAYYYYLLIDLLATYRIIKKEHSFLKDKDFDLIISDGRYGFYSKFTPCFLISHQIAFVIPKIFLLFKPVIDLGNLIYFKKFWEVFIPDFASKNNSLAGRLAHNYLLQFFKHSFVGILSAYGPEKNAKQINYLFVISGYLEEHKDSFVNKLIEQAKGLAGKKVFILGDPSQKEVIFLERDITIYPVATSALRKKLFAGAKLIISRTGYTTLMDLVEMDKKAVLFPTPNQTEQEYLARYHQKKGWFVVHLDDKNFDLNKLIQRVGQSKTFPARQKTKATLSKIEKIIADYTKENFFSLIIPAFNEEKYLEKTLTKLKNLNYERYEVIVVENGSTDQTLAIAHQHKNQKIKVLQSPKGVSLAKNKGIEQISKQSDYTIFLDADTILEKDFLRELNCFLNRNKDKRMVVGTTSILPYTPHSSKDLFWYKFYDYVHRFTHSSYSLQIAKSCLLKRIKFDPELNFSEDLKFIREMKQYGNFFFFQTNKVFTSPRRFRQEGYLKTTIKWFIQAILPDFVKKNKSYRPIR